MLQQDEGTDVPQESTKPEIQEPASDEINNETSTLVVQEVSDPNDDVSEIALTEDKLQMESVEKGNNEDITSDIPPVRSKTSKHSSKRAHKQKRDIGFHEILPVTEIINGEGLNEGEAIEGDSVLTNEADVVEDNAPEVTFPVREDSNGVLDSSEEFEHPIYADNEDEKSESLQEIVEEEMSVTSVLYKENTPLAEEHEEETEKYSLSISSSEVQQYKIAEEGYENEFKPENLYVRGSTWGGNIRSISARRPVRKHPQSVSERSSVSSDRHGNVHMSVDNHSDTECSVVTTEGSIFTSLKRKAFDVDKVGSKKRKVNETKNSIFLSMVSSPLRLFRSKLNDGIIEGHSVENISKDKKEDCDEIINDNIKKGYETKETSQYVVAQEVSNQNTTLYRSWCNIM